METNESQLQGWTVRSSDHEQDKQSRVERMVRDAIKAHAAFDGVGLRVFAKGSYKNNTNVRIGSDVDIAVECTECIYFNGDDPGPSTPYSGKWTPELLRSELVIALESKFPDGQVDSTGTTAIRVDPSSARVDADVVPCFTFASYLPGGGSRRGTRVFKKDGSWLTNYPDQQYENGVAKNTATARSYKRAVRILKRVENAMATTGNHREVPSYFVECLVYNCPNEVLLRSTWMATVRGLLAHIFHALEGDEPSEDRWMEVNGIKYLFHESQPWNREDGRVFTKAAWNYLGFKS